MEMTDLGDMFELGMEDFGYMMPPWTILESLDEITPVNSFEGNLCDNSSRREGFELKRTGEMLHFGPEKPPKIPKSERWNSADFGVSMPKQVALSPNSVINFPSEFSISQNPQTYDLSSQANRISSNMRTPCSQGHVMAERKRREKLGQKFIALSALIPGLKKMDKTSVLTDAIKYVKQLEEKVKTLETEAQKRKSMESVVLVNKYEDDQISLTADEEKLPEIEVKRCSESLLIRIHCEKKNGILEKLIAEIHKFHLSFVNSNVLTFGDGSTLDITILTKIDAEFSMTLKDLVASLRHIVSQ